MLLLAATFFVTCLWNDVYGTPSVLISSPFDNFRIECPHYSGAQRLSIRMIESQGLIRQDSVFALSCNHIEELYPWPALAQEVGDVEREDCRYSHLFDPILETQLNFTCAPREYVAGIARLSDTRIQVECCRMRTRDENHCIVQMFAKPVGTDGRVDIQYNAKLINAMAIDHNVIIVRFCDLGQRPIEAIRADLLSTTPSPPTRLPVIELSTTTTSSPPLPTVDFEEPEKEIKVPNEPKKIIKISRKSSLSSKAKWETKPVSLVPATPTSIQPMEESTQLATTESEAPTTATAETATEPIISQKEGELKEEVVRKQMSSEKEETRHHSASSIEVMAAEKIKEKSFPSEQDYENVEEARMELMQSLGNLMQARKDAKKIITRVKAAGLPQSARTSATNEEFAERMLKEIEGNGDPGKPDELLKQSMEVLADLGKVGQEADWDEENAQGGEPAEEMRKVTGWSSTDSTTTTKTESPSSTPWDTKTDIQMTIGITTPQPSATATTISNRHEENEEEESEKEGEAQIENISVEKPDDQVNFEPRPPTFPATSTSSSTTTQPSTTTTERTTQRPAIQLAPFEAFPTPPPDDRTRAPPRLLAQIARTVHKQRSHLNLEAVRTDPPPTQTTTAQTPKQERGEEYDEEAADTSTTTTTRTTSRRSRTRFPSTTRIPLYKRKFLYVETTTPEPDTTTKRASKLRSKARPQSLPRPANSVASTLNVDEETNDSPFDNNGKENIFEAAQDRNEETAQPSGEAADTDLPIDVLGGIGRSEGRSRFEKIKGARFEKHSPFDVSAEIRRAPRPRISDVSTETEVKAKAFQHPVVKSNVDMLFSGVEENHHHEDDGGSGELYQAKDILALPPTSKDGTRNFEPKGNQPVKMPEIIVYDTLDLKNLPPLVRKIEKEAGKHRSSNGIVNNLVEMKEKEHVTHPPLEQSSAALPKNITQMPDTSTVEQTFPYTTTTPAIASSSSTSSSSSSTSSSSTPTEAAPAATEAETEDPYWTIRTAVQTLATAAPYNPSKFYFMPKARRPKKEKVLTFCTKDTAVRDQNNLVIACGGDIEVWLPNRCPPRTDCFITADSTYRLCCPVASH